MRKAGESPAFLDDRETQTRQLTICHDPSGRMQAVP